MEQIKVPFFVRLKRAIFNPESYSNFILEKTKEGIKYFFKFLIIFSIIVSIVQTIDFYNQGIGEEQLNILRDYGFDEMHIQEVKDFYEQTNGFYIIAIAFIANLISSYVIYGISTLLTACVFSVFGLIIARICGIKLKFGNAFNLAIYAITLPTILLAIYMIVNILFGIEIKYFSLAYDAITYIYIITAVLMLRADLIKQKIELTKIIKEQEKVKEEVKEKEEKKKDKNDENDELNGNEEPQGNKA